MTIYHLAWKSDWHQFSDQGYYRPPGLAAEGFIHATREPEIVVEVANQFFSGPPPDELLLIEIAESSLESPVVDEDPGVGHVFPHIYGPINLAAVIAVEPMRRVGDRWERPERIL